MAKHALLFAGCYDNNHTEIRYNNDIGFMYEVLQKNTYDQITVLYTDGTPIEYNNSQIATIVATYDSFKTTLENYAALLTADDQLTIMITNHGTLDNKQALIVCWDKPFISANEFNSLIGKIKCKKIIIHGQCKGGNFLEKIDNSIIISANCINEDSYSTRGAQYDEFLYHFISFFNKCYPDNTSLQIQPSHNSIKAAFEYCRDFGSYRIPLAETSKTGKIRIIHEDPQIISTNLDPELITL
ncbi:hypothetical protein MKZ07_33445 [Paenibacillus sp. FSL P4-0338]|uniref:hypothetical protein n=1 Tax=Paenibacillus sp. FSL P4-0338 TaxID=2921635 RepID=UPI0030FCF8A8